jgi:hypothetical protein
MGGFQKMTQTKWFYCFFYAYFLKIFENFRYKESEENRMSDLMLPFTLLKNFDLLYSRVGAGAGAAGAEAVSKFSSGAA